MPIIREYECPDCTERLREANPDAPPFRFEKLHMTRDEPPPECPGCTALSALKVPSSFGIKGNASRAMDIAQDILEKDYGMTDARDHLREGDITAKVPAKLEAQANAMFKPATSAPIPGNVIAQAKAGALAAKAEGRNPFSMVQKVNKSRGSAKVLCKPVAVG